MPYNSLLKNCSKALHKRLPFRNSPKLETTEGRSDGKTRKKMYAATG